MKRELLMLCLLWPGAGATAAAQAKNSDDCRLTVADLKSGQVVEAFEFKTVVAEEELTNNVLWVPATGLQITASVFYTDESMASKHGFDSMQLGLVVAPKAWASAFEAPNNAVAEVTYATFDTAQVFTNIYAKGRRWLVSMKCQQGFRAGAKPN